MRKKNYKGRAVKRKIEKCEGICVTYDDLHMKMVDTLSENDDVAEIHCNVKMEGMDYTSDIVAMMKDGHLVVFECSLRKLLNRPTVAKALDESRQYWLKHGVLPEDWRLVIDAEKSAS